MKLTFLGPFSRFFSALFAWTEMLLFVSNSIAFV